MEKDYKKLLNEEIERIKPFYDKVVERSKTSNNLMDSAYRHEGRTVIGRLTQAQELMKLKGESDFANELIKHAYEIELPHLKNLEEMVQMGDLTKEKIQTGKTNFYELIERQQNIHKEYLNSKNIQYNNFGNKNETDFNEGVAATLISMHYGNSVKWAKENSKINVKIKKTRYTKKKKHHINYQIQLENEFGETPLNPGIGENEGIGTLFTNTILKTIKGKVEYYNEAELSNTKNPVYGIKLTLPIK
ncbi:hypothetical protein GW932_04225 [archaeon]|nr:hypothetical protein [archaeon]